MATKIPAAQTRLFKNVFVCRRCKAKIRGDPVKIKERIIKCRRCQGKVFRPVKKK